MFNCDIFLDKGLISQNQATAKAHWLGLAQNTDTGKLFTYSAQILSLTLRCGNPKDLFSLRLLKPITGCIIVSYVYTRCWYEK